MPKETLGEVMREGLQSSGMSQAELARAVKVSPTYIGNLLRDLSPSSESGTPRPSPEIVDRIARSLGLPPARARLAAGYAPGDTNLDAVDFEAERLLHFYRALPEECRKDVLALTEALWKRREAEGRAERIARKSGGKHRPQTTKPGKVRKGREQKAS